MWKEEKQRKKEDECIMIFSHITDYKENKKKIHLSSDDRPCGKI